MDAQLLMNIMWTMLGAFLVYFMQAGFAMVETGFTRAKNAGNILMKNMMDFVLGSLFFFILGFAIMFGGDGGAQTHACPTTRHSERIARDQSTRLRTSATTP